MNNGQTRAQQILETYNDVISQMISTMDSYAKTTGGYIGQDKTHLTQPEVPISEKPIVETKKRRGRPRKAK